jgi:hypothetical protein
MHLSRFVFGKTSSHLLILPILLVVFLASCVAGGSSTNPPRKAGHEQAPRVPVMLKGKTASLSWIYGRDCLRGMQAYLQSAGADPDAALVGTGWVKPTDGSLMNGHNTCVAGGPSMDRVVQLVHSRGGMAYLTITMDTEGPDPWSVQQAAAYIDKATTDQGYIDTIVHEVVRAGYDGVIMDLEGVDHSYPAIQHVFASYNQRLWAALRGLHKWYGIALIPKVRDNDYNFFENWRLLAHAADFVVIMAVDESYFTPGPAVSLPWLKRLLTYALQTMPEMVPRMIWELPLYGDIWHWEKNRWVFDEPITFQAAQALVLQATPAHIDAHASAMQDVYAPHVVYTDASGVKHAVWYPTGKSLCTIISSFWQTLKQEPRFGKSRLQIAVWWRTTQEPQDFWPLLDQLY